MRNGEVVCWEALDPEDPVLGRARRLYESTLDAAERIPWQWIEGAVAGRRSWRPGQWSAHLLIAALPGRGQRERVVGFAYGIHVPAYGGYACYLGVDPQQRRRGAGTRLLGLLVQVLKVDAACEGVKLPFVVWESRRPAPGASPEEQAVWAARLRLFEKLGAWWVSGLDFLAPDFARRGGPPVPLQLFLLPVDSPPDAFDAEALRGVAAGLLHDVYGRGPGDPLVDRTLPPDCRPSLRPVREMAADPPAAGQPEPLTHGQKESSR